MNRTEREGHVHGRWLTAAAIRTWEGGKELQRPGKRRTTAHGTRSRSRPARGAPLPEFVWPTTGSARASRCTHARRAAESGRRGPRPWVGGVGPWLEWKRGVGRRCVRRKQDDDDLHGWPRRKGERGFRESITTDGFAKQKMCWWRGRWDKPRSGSGIRRRCPRWPEKLAEPSPEKFAGNKCKTSAIDLQGYEWRLAKRVVLLKSTHRGLRRHIYKSRVCNFWKNEIFYNYIISGLK
jgi:hypothetical protein